MNLTLFRSLRHRNFRLFFGGQLISLIGTWMQTLAQSWLVYQLSHSGFALGLVSFAGQFPVFLLSPVGGAAADRWNRHRLIIATQTASMLLAFILAAATLAGHVTVTLVVVLATLLAIVSAFDIPARQAFIVAMVEDKDDLMNGIALNSSIFNAARVVGPAVAGILLAKVGTGWCFFWNGISYIAVIASLLLMRVPRPARAPFGAGMLRHFGEGYRYIRRVSPIQSLLLLVGALSLVSMPFTVLMPILAVRDFHRGASGLAQLMAWSGVGALAGALLLAARKTIVGLGRVISWSCLGLGAGLLLMGAPEPFRLALGAVAGVGFCLIVATSAINTLVQSLLEERFRGRVMSVYAMMFMGMAPLGGLLVGWLSEVVSTPRVLGLEGVLTLLAAAVFARHLPHLRHAARIILAQETSGEEPAVAEG